MAIGNLRERAGGIGGRLGLTSGGIGLGTASILGWALAYLAGGRTLFLMAYAAAAALGGAYLIARRRRPLTAIRSELPLRARAGQALPVTITISASRRLTSFVVMEKLHPHLGRPVRIPVTSLSSEAEMEHTYVLRPRLRGVYEVGPLIAEWSDPFGLAVAEQRLAAPTRLIVHPSVEPALDRPLARQFEEPPVRPPRTRPWPSGFEFYGMRDYVPGDDLRRIVWRAVARTGRILVREFEQGITDRVNIVLDSDRDWHRPGDPSDTFETAVRVAASVGSLHLREGFSVTLETNSRRLTRNLRGPQARIALLDELASVNRDGTVLSTGLGRILSGSTPGAHTVVVTSHVDTDAAAQLRLLIERGGSVVVVALVWEESDPLTIQRAGEIGATVVEMRPGDALAGVFSSALGVRR